MTVTWRARPWAPLLVGVAVLPIVVALGRALLGGWYPVGDNAYFAIRARDVLTEHHPLLGTWTSASLSTGTDMNNPGPLFWDLLAIPARIDPIGGLAVGVAVINLLAVLAIAKVAHRGGGWARAGALLVAATAMSWSMGSALLVEPWQPHSLLLPFMLLLAVLWGIAEGDAWLLPLAVFVGSFLVQTHLSYAPLVAALGLAALVSSVIVHRSGLSDDPGPLRRPLLWSAGVALVCWSQPVLEQVTAEEQGNLSRLIGSGTSDGGAPLIGLATAARMVADSTLIPPAWARSAFAEPFGEVPRLPGEARFGGLPSPAATAIAGALALLVTGVAVALARRREDRGAVIGAIGAGLALVVAWLTVSIIPLGPAGFGIHQVRWLWPLGLVFLAVLVLAMVGDVPALRWTWAGLAVVFALLAIPAHTQQTGPASDDQAVAVLNDVADQLGALDLDGPVLFAAEDLRSMPVYEPYSTPLMLEMDRRGVGFVLDDPSHARQVGSSRLHPERARHRIVLLMGDSVDEPPPSGQRLALVEGLSAEERSALETRREELVADLVEDGLVLSPRGDRLATAGRLPGIGAGGAVVDSVLLVQMRTLHGAVDHGLVAPSEPRLDDIEAYVEAQRRWDRGTVGVWAVPLDEPAEVIGG